MEVVEGLSAYQLFCYALWSAALMFFLAWSMSSAPTAASTSTPPTGERSRSSSRSAKQQVPSDTSAAVRRKPSSKNVLRADSWSASEFRGGGGGGALLANNSHSSSSSQFSAEAASASAPAFASASASWSDGTLLVAGSAGVESDDEEEDDSADIFHSTLDAQETQQPPVPDASSSPEVGFEVQQPSSASAAAAAAAAAGPPATTLPRTKLVIPLRGRSQSSYNNIDIPVTIIRRKSSMDDIQGSDLAPSSGTSLRSSAGGDSKMTASEAVWGTDNSGVWFDAPMERRGTVSSADGSPSQTQPLSPEYLAALEAVASVPIDPKLVIKRGCLFKLSLKKSLASIPRKAPEWKQREFVLSGFYLSYQDSMKRRNEFDLRGCQVLVMLAHKSPSSGLNVDMHAITISSIDGSRTMVLAGSSEAHRDEWAQCLEDHLFRINRQEEELDGEMEENRYKGIPTPLEQLLLNPPLRKRTDTASEAIHSVAQAEFERMRPRNGSSASQDSPTALAPKK